MITRQQLRQIHPERLPLHVLEQDYIQALFLSTLYRQTDQLCFKGGTYIKHALGLDRFSEDLDFTSIDGTGHGNDLQTATDAMRRYGVRADLEIHAEGVRSLTAKLRYEGPLYNGTILSRGSITIDVSKRHDLFIPPIWRRLFFVYPELRVVNVLGLTDEELIVEKLRALSVRENARDLYDLWFLLNLGLQVDTTLFEKKMAVVNANPAVIIHISKAMWTRDLEILLEHPPSYETVRASVVARLEKQDLTIME